MIQPSLQFQLVAGAGISSRAIGYFGGGFYSHVDIVWPDGRLFGARSDVIKVNGLTYPAGAQFRPQNYEVWRARTRIDIPCTFMQRNRALEWALHQEGKPYDKRAILGFASGRDWRTEGEWFCSEMASRYIEVGFRFKLALTDSKINPGTFACVASTARGMQIEAAASLLAA